MYNQDSSVDQKVNILLVEDCPDSRAIFEQVLKKIGANITCAENGRECVDLALNALNCNHGFDVILMDIQMPVMYGNTAARSLRDNGYNLPILAMTAKLGPNDKRESELAGFDGHISKLTGMNGLISEVQKQLLKSKTVEIEMPVLPLVPQFLRENPNYAEFALSSISTLENKIEKVKSLIDEHDFEGIKELMYQFGNLSLYGYSQFSHIVSQIQISADNKELNSLESKYELLKRSSKAIIAGIPQLRKISNLH